MRKVLRLFHPCLNLVNLVKNLCVFAPCVILKSLPLIMLHCRSASPARDSSRVLQHLAVIDLQKIVKFCPPIPHENLLPPFGLVFRKIKEHHDHPVHVAELNQQLIETGGQIYSGLRKNVAPLPALSPHCGERVPAGRERGTSECCGYGFRETALAISSLRQWKAVTCYWFVAGSVTG